MARTSSEAAPRRSSDSRSDKIMMDRRVPQGRRCDGGRRRGVLRVTRTSACATAWPSEVSVPRHRHRRTLPLPQRTDRRRGGHPRLRAGDPSPRRRPTSQRTSPRSTNNGSLEVDAAMPTTPKKLAGSGRNLRRQRHQAARLPDLVLRARRVRGLRKLKQALACQRSPAVARTEGHEGDQHLQARHARAGGPHRLERRRSPRPRVAQVTRPRTTACTRSRGSKRDLNERVIDYPKGMRVIFNKATEEIHFNPLARHAEQTVAADRGARGDPGLLRQERLEGHGRSRPRHRPELPRRTSRTRPATSRACPARTCAARRAASTSSPRSTSSNSRRSPRHADELYGGRRTSTRSRWRTAPPSARSSGVTTSPTRARRSRRP
jgi:hypothetical protein